MFPDRTRPWGGGARRWERAEEATCTSAAAARGFDDSDAKLASVGLKHLRNVPKTGPFTPDGAFMSDLAFDGGYAYHTHTVIPQADRLLIYVQSYDVSATKPNCQPPHDKISIVEIPKSDPAAAHVINEPVLFAHAGNPGEPGGTQRATTGCHDITVYQEIGLAAGACTGQGVILDISDPVNPKVLSSVEDANFAFWHSATISNDGKKVLFTGGIYDITDPANRGS